MIKNLLLTLIRAYQKSKIFHGPALRMFFMSDKVCRFTPSCSEYTYQAIEKYGAGKGSWLGLKRICRCHPWNKGGLDMLK